MSRIIDFSKRKQKVKTEKIDDDIHNFLVCPYCHGSYFAPILKPHGDQYSVRYLVCVSELCEGEVYVELSHGLLSSHFLERGPVDQPPDGDGGNDNTPPSAA